MKDKKGFFIFNDSLLVLSKLTPEQAGNLFVAIANYQKDGSLPEDNFTSIIFQPFLNQFERDEVAYSKICERNKKVANGRWEKKSEKKNNTTLTNANLEAKNKTSPLVVDNPSPSLKEPTPPLARTYPSIKKEGEEDKIRAMELPEYINKDLWLAFVDNRKKMRKPLSYNGASIILKKLSDFKNNGFDPNISLEDAVAFNYQGVFEPKRGVKKEETFDEIRARALVELKEHFKDRLN